MFQEETSSRLDRSQQVITAGCAKQLLKRCPKKLMLSTSSGFWIKKVFILAPPTNLQNEVTQNHKVSTIGVGT